MVHEYLKAIKNGKIVLIKTDIGWELVCDVRQLQAVEKLVAFGLEKKENPYCVLLVEIGLIRSYAADIADVAWDIIEYEEKPLSVIFPKNQQIPDIVPKPIAIRLVKTSPVLEVLTKLGRPILSISLETDKLQNIAPTILEKVFEVKEGKATPEVSQKHTILSIGQLGEIEFIKR